MCSADLEQDLYEFLPVEVSADFKIYINYSIASIKPQKFLFIIQNDVYIASIIPIKTSDNFQYITINIINVTYLQSSNKTSSINEKYMSVLNKASELLLKSYKNIPYQEFLITLSSALDVSRVYIFLNHWDSAGNAYMSQIAEWCSEGIEPQIDNPMLQNLPYGFSPRRWFETMTNGGIIIGNVSDSPEGERQHLESQDIATILVIPFFQNEVFYGFIGFDCCYVEKHWNNDEINFLHIVANFMSQALNRQYAEDVLKESEQKYKILSNATSDYMYVCSREKDKPYSLKWIGGNLELITGFSIQEITKFGCWMHIVSDEDKEKVKNYLLNLKPGDTGSLQFRIKTKDGQTKWILDRSKCSFDYKDGNKYLLYGASRDISERKKYEFALIESEQNLKNILNSINSFIYVTDLNTYKILFVNDYGKNLFGDIEGKICWEAIQNNQSGPCEFCTNKKLLDENGKPGEPYIWEFNNTIINRRALCIDRAMHWSDGRLVRIEIATDIEEIKAYQDQLALTTEKLEKLNKDKDKFFSIIAHDLKGPLSNFLELTKIIINEFDDLTLTELHRYTDAIYKSSNKLYRLLTNLLDWSRIQNGTMNIKKEKLNLFEIINNSVEFLEVYLTEKSIDIKIDVSDDIYINVDKFSVETIFRNLISNAIKFSRKNSQIVIDSTINESNIVLVEIQDFGIGMSKDILDDLFSITHKASRLGTNNEIGSGLGLILVKELILLNDGEIYVQSKDKIGSSFYVKFKVAQ